MSRLCTDCGQKFDTLSSYRLHDCPETLTGKVELDEDDDTVQIATDQLLTCDNCGAKADEVDAAEELQAEDEFGVIVYFECPECDYINHNTVVLE